MIKVNIRRQGGAAIMTIPSNVLKRLNVEVGASLELDVNDERQLGRCFQIPLDQGDRLAEYVKLPSET